MTELEHVEIEGFKGLEHVEFEPTDINLITGRNNTGKTSFLEAVDLLFNPANLTDFGDNLDSVIHKDCEHSDIRGKTGESEVKTGVRTPSEPETNKFFFQAVPRVIGYQTAIHQFAGENKPKSSTDHDDSEDFRQTFERMEKSLNGILEEKLVRDSNIGLSDEILVLSTTTDEYPCFLGGKRSTAIMREILEELKSGFKQHNNIEKIDIQEGRQGPEGHIKFLSRAFVIRLPPKNTFTEKPKNTDSATFIKSTDFVDGIERTDDEQEPIKIDDIGDFIRDTELVTDLKTFTLDYLVFEEQDGEKKQIPYDFMGDGFKSIVGLLWELMDDGVENDIVLIEEPENHMHPGYVAELVHFLIDLARDEDIQFFITTHDHDFIKDFFMDMPDEKREYLEDEFSLVKMDDFGAESLDYETAEHDLKDLHLDLRGI